MVPSSLSISLARRCYPCFAVLPPGYYYYYSHHQHYHYYYYSATAPPPPPPSPEYLSLRLCRPIPLCCIDGRRYRRARRVVKKRRHRRRLPRVCLRASACVSFLVTLNATATRLCAECSLPLAPTLSTDIFPVTFSLPIASSTPRIYTFLVEPSHSTLVSSLFPSLYSGYTLLLFYTRGGCGVVPANPPYVLRGIVKQFHLIVASLRQDLC